MYRPPIYILSFLDEFYVQYLLIDAIRPWSDASYITKGGCELAFSKKPNISNDAKWSRTTNFTNLLKSFKEKSLMIYIKQWKFRIPHLVTWFKSCETKCAFCEKLNDFQRVKERNFRQSRFNVRWKEKVTIYHTIDPLWLPVGSWFALRFPIFFGLPGGRLCGRLNIFLGFLF